MNEWKVKYRIQINTNQSRPPEGLENTQSEID